MSDKLQLVVASQQTKSLSDKRTPLFRGFISLNHSCKLIAIQSQLNQLSRLNDLKDFSSGVHILCTWLQNIFGF